MRMESSRMALVPLLKKLQKVPGPLTRWGPREETLAVNWEADHDDTGASVVDFPAKPASVTVSSHLPSQPPPPQSSLCQVLAVQWTGQQGTSLLRTQSPHPS